MLQEWDKPEQIYKPQLRIQWLTEVRFPALLRYQPEVLPQTIARNDIRREQTVCGGDIKRPLLPIDQDLVAQTLGKVADGWLQPGDLGAGEELR